MEVNLELQSKILNIIDDQLSSNNPPEVNETFVRLQKEGFDTTDARKLIGQCIVLELYDMIKKKKEFNLERYLANLDRLPEEPWE